eukprot:GABW01001042.1.p2 GENE.GABW01001042.1~~GABW01001042.1.p2  ORF type:complete len:94 (+),score=22.57 GABW01001042.1:27-308(+)
MSKISSEQLQKTIELMLKQSQEKGRKFTESVELQISLKNYDPRKDKRFAGTLVLPHVARRNLHVCVFGDVVHLDAAKEAGVDCLSSCTNCKAF